MSSARLPTPSDPLAPAGMRAENNAACLRLVAAQHGRLSAELAPSLGRQGLEVETAHTLVSIARETAARLRRDGQPAPAGNDLFDRVVRGAWQIAQDREDEETDAALDQQLD